MSPPSSGLKGKQARNQHEAGNMQSTWLGKAWNYIKPKGLLSQKTELFITTAD
jgi:hypothetical protein